MRDAMIEVRKAEVDALRHRADAMQRAAMRQYGRIVAADAEIARLRSALGLVEVHLRGSDPAGAAKAVERALRG